MTKKPTRASVEVPAEDTEFVVSGPPWHPDQPAGGEGPTGAPGGGDAVLETGTLLGEFRIETLIGEGGMGMVYSAVHPLIGKRAAVKVLRKELCRDAFVVERFIDEARVVNQIGHPNIVDVFAFGETADGRSYFVMEWLKGETLRARIARSRVELPELLAIMKPLVRALEAAHAQGIIHRDLKPDNVYLVDVRGEATTVKLLDFGIAKLVRSEHRVAQTATGAMVGTPQYIAPEQAKGYAIDHRVDLYSLGCILFELLTGRPPFVADNAMEMVAKHLMEPPPWPSLFAPVPHPVDELVVRMLAKDPAARPSLGEVVAVLERAKPVSAAWDGAITVTGQARPSANELRNPSAVAVTQPPTAIKPTRRSWLIAFGVLVLAGAVFVVVRASATHDPAPPPSETAPERAVAPAPEHAVVPEAAPPAVVPVDAAAPEAAPPVDAAAPVEPKPPTTVPGKAPTPKKPGQRIPPRPPKPPKDEGDMDLLNPGTIKRGGRS